MEKKTAYRYKASLSDLDNKDSHNMSFVTPFPIDVQDIANIFTSCCEVRINDIMNGVLGYNYTPVDTTMCTVSCKGSYEFGGVPYTTERMYFKYVKANQANQDSFLPYMKQIFGNSFKFVAFTKSFK